VVQLRLGQQNLQLVGFEPKGRPYPRDVPGWSRQFQHLAIVVSDMSSAYKRLSRSSGWEPISRGGPQTLPPASGHVTAFKFRDSEGHPLELLAFPHQNGPAKWRRKSSAAIFLGIDHSAITVADTARSVCFYEQLGFRRGATSENAGAEQSKLDDVCDAHVKVTSLVPTGQKTPHLELLCYRGIFERNAELPQINDVAATTLLIRVESRAAIEAIARDHCQALISSASDSKTPQLLLHDPDRHLIQIEGPNGEGLSSRHKSRMLPPSTKRVAPVT
jgi:catechol 2,3-dioxygenase-like lactoylglutathione lyase family enzyme